MGSSMRIVASTASVTMGATDVILFICLLGHSHGSLALENDGFRNLSEVSYNVGNVEVSLPFINNYEASVAKFVLAVDNSGRMKDCNRLLNLKAFMKRFVDNLMINTKVA